MKYCSSCQASYPHDYTACPKDQTPLQLVTDLMPGLVLRGKYEILQKLGAGGMGAVYKARHLAFGELRAIKFVGNHLLEDERALARFRAEAVVARRLQHPNAVKVEDLDTSDDGRPFIVMEYVEGRSLRDLFYQDLELTTKRILGLTRQACGALAAAHALGIVHRDIKPDNLMVVAGPDGTEILKVADFGLAKVREGFEPASDHAFTKTGFLVGTPPYMSPEQASGLEVDGRSDLYSLGVVLYELLTGRLPFNSDSPLGMLMHHRETPLQPPSLLGVPQALSEFLLKALAKRREDRFQTAEQMEESLRQLALLSLPEFAGEGIRGGFDPQWAGSRRASRITTVQQASPPTASLAGKPSGQDATVATPGHRPSPSTGSQRRPASEKTLKLPQAPPPTRTRPVTTQVQNDVPESSPARFWMWISIAGVVGVGLLAMRSGREQVDTPSPSTIEPAAQARPPVEAPSEPAGASGPTDPSIRRDIERVLLDSTALRDARIQVEIANGVVTLVGEAPSQTAAQLATSLAASVSGVRQVFSTLQVSEAHPTETTAANPAPASAASPSAATPPPVAVPAEPSRPTTTRAEDAIREQVRTLLDRAREKLDARTPEAASSAELDLLAVLKLDPTNAVAKEHLERLKNRPPPPPPPPPGPRPTREK